MDQVPLYSSYIDPELLLWSLTIIFGFWTLLNIATLQKGFLKTLIYLNKTKLFVHQFTGSGSATALIVLVLVISFIALLDTITLDVVTFSLTATLSSIKYMYTNSCLFIVMQVLQNHNQKGFIAICTRYHNIKKLLWYVVQKNK